MEDICKVEPPTWYNSPSIDYLEVAAEDAVFITFHETQREFPEKLWQASLLPQWELIRHKDNPRRLLWVVTVCKRRAGVVV